MNHQDFPSYDPGIILFIFTIAITGIAGCIMCAFGYTKIADIIKMCMVGIILIAFFITICISIYEYLRNKLSDKQNKEKK